MKSYLTKKDSFLKRNSLFIFVYAFILIFSIFIILLVAWGLLTSLKSDFDFSLNNNLFGWPTLDQESLFSSYEEFFHLANYQTVFNNFTVSNIVQYYRGSVEVTHNSGVVGFPMMLLNSVLYSVVGAFIYATMPCLTAYLCAKYPYKYSKVLFVIYTVMMCLPIVGNFPSEITFLRNAGLYDEIWGNWLQKMGGGGMYFFVYYAFFKGLSNTYREAAEIDGASELRIMLRVYFPLTIKVFSTVFLIQFVALWNDFSTPLLYLPTHQTLAYGVYQLAFNKGGTIDLQSIPVKIAACMVLALPILIVFIIFKDKLMGNISLGGIKE